MRPNRSLPPLELARSVSPSQAGELPARRELVRIGDRRRQSRRGDDPDPRNGLKASGDLVAPEPRHQILIKVS